MALFSIYQVVTSDVYKYHATNL